MGAMREKESSEWSSSRRTVLKTSAGMIGISAAFGTNATAHSGHSTSGDQFEWKADLGSTFTTGVARHGSDLFVGSWNELVKLDRNTGDIQSRAVAGEGAIRGDPVVLQNGVAVSTPYKLTIFSRDSLDTQWSAEFTRRAIDIQQQGDTLYVLFQRDRQSNDPAKVVGLAPSNGERLWEYSLEGGATGLMSPGGSDTIVTERNGTITRLTSKGNERWVTSTRNPVNTLAAKSNTGLHILDTRRPREDIPSQLYTIDINNGEIDWSTELAQPSRDTEVLPIGNELIVPTQGGYQIVSKRDNSALGSIDTKTPPTNSQIIGQNEFVGVTQAGMVHKGKIQDGSLEKIATLPTKHVVVDGNGGDYTGSAGSISVSKNIAYIMTNGGEIVSVPIKGGSQ